LLARLAFDFSPAGPTVHRLKSISNGVASSTFVFGFGRLA
jgi:hypothetical protein